MAIFLAVTDHELLTAQIVKSILLTVLVIGIILNLFWAWGGHERRKKINRGIAAIVLFVLAVPIVQWIRIDGSLLYSGEYAIGTTIGYCEVFAKGKGIEFEYEADGKKYKNCNTYHPLSINDIIRPNGKYYVRYSNKYPEKGRIDFNKPVK